MTHISRDAELRLLMDLDAVLAGAGEALPRVTRTEILDARRVIRAQVHVAPAVREALVNIADETRKTDRVVQGVSTRSLVLMMPALQALACLRGRAYVTADDVEALAPTIFSHRLMVAPGGGAPEEVIAACCRRPLELLARSTLRR